MALGMIGLKVGMTQVYDEHGGIAPVTVLQIGPNPILQVRSKERDGYDAVQLGFMDKPREKAIRSERGHVADSLVSKRKEARKSAGITPPPKANCEPQRFMREFRLDKAREDLKVGDKLTADKVFEGITAVDVSGNSKGRGFTGVMKKHNYQGLRGSHGVKKGNRQRGSTGSHAANRGSGRPKRGIRMAGRYGNERVTVRNLLIVRIDPVNNVVLVKGAVPGPNGGMVLIRPTNKKAQVNAPRKIEEDTKKKKK